MKPIDKGNKVPETSKQEGINAVSNRGKATYQGVEPQFLRKPNAIFSIKKDSEQEAQQCNKLEKGTFSILESIGMHSKQTETGIITKIPFNLTSSAHHTCEHLPPPSFLCFTGPKDVQNARKYGSNLNCNPNIDQFNSIIHCKTEREEINPVFHQPQPYETWSLKNKVTEHIRANNRDHVSQEELKSPDEPELHDDNNPSKSGNNQLPTGLCYKSRNVYKSLIRHMFSYLKKNRDAITQQLLNAGYEMKYIEHEYYKIHCYNDLQNKKGGKKNSQETILKILSKKSARTFVLRDTLHSLLESGNQGKFGKASEKNSHIYKEACEKFYTEAIQTIGQDKPIKQINDTNK